jgi:hypothetical protein
MESQLKNIRQRFESLGYCIYQTRGGGYNVITKDKSLLLQWNRTLDELEVLAGLPVERLSRILERGN